MRRVDPQRGLVQELKHSHRTVVLTLCAMLLASLASSGYLILVSQPAVSQYADSVRDARLMHEAMLDQETGLRGWLATGDRAYLDPAFAGRRQEAETARQILRRAAADSETTVGLVPALHAQYEWKEWADRAAGWRVTARERNSGELIRFLVEGKDLFDDYRAVQGRATTHLVAQRDRAIDGQRVALIIALVATLAMLAAGGAHARLRRRRLERAVLRPMRLLLTTIESLRSGDLSARSRSTGVRELDAIGTALNGFARELHEADELAAWREARLALLARRLETVISMACETSASLSVSEVGESVAAAAADLLGAPARLWVRDSEGALRTLRSGVDQGPAPSGSVTPSALVGTVAADARPQSDDACRAYPLVVAGSVVGVLETGATAPDADVEHVLAALLSTAAAGIESARLHTLAREQADIDALTRLPNRRLLERDLTAEWQRSRRHHRPFTFVMLDLDRFKSLNDTHGHPVGDVVLRVAASAMAATLRETDTAYRYGGEEFAVLLRETSLEEAVGVAERLRTAVAAAVVPGHAVAVTASLGVAQVEPAMSDQSDLVTAADGALYRAKRNGRNRVETANCVEPALA